MTRTGIFGMATAVLLGATAAVPAFAERGGHAGPGGPGGPARLDFEAIDTDGSGTLSAAELTGRATGRIAEADADGDGTLDREEIIATMPAGRPGLAAPFGPDRAAARADRMLAMMGESESGRIAIDELAGRQADRLLAAADTDRNGEISQAEADAMSEHARGLQHHRHGDRL